MPKSPCSLLLAMTLVALPVDAAAQSPSRAPSPVQTPVEASTKSTRKGKPASSTAKRGAKPVSSPRSPAAKGAAADCDTPQAKVAPPPPLPVAANPLAATLAPCAEPKPRS